MIRCRTFFCCRPKMYIYIIYINYQSLIVWYADVYKSYLYRRVSNIHVQKFFYIILIIIIIYIYIHTSPCVHTDQCRLRFFTDRCSGPAHTNRLHLRGERGAQCARPKPMCSFSHTLSTHEPCPSVVDLNTFG